MRSAYEMNDSAHERFISSGGAARRSIRTHDRPRGRHLNAHAL